MVDLGGYENLANSASSMYGRSPRNVAASV